MSWLSQHMEEFVKPVLGFIPTLEADKRIFTPQEMSVIKGMWRAVKREAKRLRRPILLAGRDVWIFEVLARREATPTVFRPDISRLTAQHVQEDYSGHFLFDTGFLGSIPRALKCESFTMGSSNVALNATVGQSIDPWTLRRTKGHKLLTTDPKQVFPRMKGARSLILKIERTPKYWQRGYYRAPDRAYCKCDGPWNWAIKDNLPTYCTLCQNHFALVEQVGIGQDLSDKEQFLAAAKLTIEIYKDSSPSFVDGPVKIGGIYSGVVGYD